METMNPDDITTFLAVLDAGGYHAAADLSSRTASAVHKDVKRLEADLGVKLFFTVGRTVHPTPEALDLQPFARDVVATTAQLRERAQNLRTGARGSIRIACNPYHIGRFLASAKRAFNIAHPGIDLKLEIESADASFDPEGRLGKALQGSVDFAVSGPDNPQFDSIELWKTHVVVVMRDDHQLRKRKTLRLQDLENEPLFTCIPSFWSRRQLEALAQRQQLPLNIEFDSSPEAIFSAAMAGLGCAVFGDDHVPPHMREPFPALLDEHGKRMSTAVHLRWIKDRSQSPAMRAFIDFIAERRDEFNATSSAATA
jgi:DNA-binding transcriptional LysR family regulator